MPKRKRKKRKKSSRMRGSSTHGGGARKKRKKSGHRGGKGMSGSGKRADHKKTLITKKYGHGYFGKKGLTSKKTEKDKRLRINLKDILENLDSYADEKGIVNLEEYKILGEGEVNKKIIIKAKEASKSAIEKIKKEGGEILLPEKKEKKEKPEKTNEDKKEAE